MRCQKLSQLINTAEPAPSTATVELFFQENVKIRSVARSVSRNGASSFSVDGVTMTFGEYQEALKSIGFDNDMQNYVVFQGDIQNLALMKPKMLTKLFEDASGSAQYKEEYEQTEAAVKRTEIQLGHLEDQRDVLAQRRKKLKGECKETQLWTENDAEIARISDEKRIFEMHQIALDIESSIDKVKSTQETLKSLREQKSIYDESLRLTDETVGTMEKSIKHSQKQMTQQKKEIRQQETKVLCLSAEAEEVHKQIEALKQECTTLKEQMKADQAERKHLTKVISQFDKEYHLLFEHRSRLELVREQMNNSNDEKRAQMMDQIKAANDNIQRLKERIQEDDKKLQEIQASEQEAPTIPDASNLHQKKAKLERLQKDLSSRLRNYTDYKRRGRESKKAVREQTLLSTLQKELDGVYGFVRDLYKTTRRKHGEMVSAGLGYHLHEIVVRDKRTAIECIKLAKKHNAGNYTFLPISELCEKEETGDGIVLPLRSFLEYDSLYEPVFRFVTKGVYGCENPGEAKKNWITKRWKKIVDVNGTIYRANGTITGGQLQGHDRGYSNSVSQKEEIQNIQDKIDDLEQEIKQEEFLYLTEKQQAEVRLLELGLVQKKKAQLAEHLELLCNELSSREVFLENLNSELSNMEQSANLSQMIEDTTEHQELVQLFHQKSINDLMTTYTHFLELERDINDKRAILDNLSESRTKHRLTELQHSIDENQKLELKVNQDKNAEDSKLSELKQTLEQQETKQSEMKEHFTKAKKQRREIFGKFTRCENEILEKEHSLSQTETVTKAAKAELKHLIACSGNQITISDLNELAQNLPEHLRVSKPMAQRQSIIESYQKRIKSIEKDQESLHPNFKSIESLEKVRHDIKQLDQQLETLRPALRANISNFKTVKKKRTTLFMDFFQRVEGHLQDIYASLTSSQRQPLGGNAYLSAIHPQTPFLDGIIYSVVPPMKRYRTLEHLSGGEQTLAVLSLLFAMNKVHSSPCFILDEIDSALDKANLQMVATFLKNESESQQIIIVSHREQVYSECNSLVGICKNFQSNSSMCLYFPLDELLNDDDHMDEPSQISWH